jgi:hypothetical protein
MLSEVAPERVQTISLGFGAPPRPTSSKPSFQTVTLATSTRTASTRPDLAIGAPYSPTGD